MTFPYLVLLLTYDISLSGAVVDILPQVQLLHEAGAKIDVTDKDGCTSLHLASNEGHVDVVHLLVECKCAVDQTQSDGATPLFLASQEGHSHVAQVSMCLSMDWLLMVICLIA